MKEAEDRSADLLIVSENNLSWFRYYIREDHQGKFLCNAPCPIAVISDQPAMNEEHHKTALQSDRYGHPQQAAHCDQIHV